MYSTLVPSRTAMCTFSPVVEDRSCMNGSAVSRNSRETAASAPRFQMRRPIS